MNFFLIFVVYFVSIGQVENYNCTTPHFKAGYCINVFKCLFVLNKITELEEINSTVIEEYAAYRCEICDEDNINVCCPIVTENDTDTSTQIEDSGNTPTGLETTDISNSSLISTLTNISSSENNTLMSQDNSFANNAATDFPETTTTTYTVEDHTATSIPEHIYTIDSYEDNNSSSYIGSHSENNTVDTVYYGSTLDVSDKSESSSYDGTHGVENINATNDSTQTIYSFEKDTITSFTSHVNFKLLPTKCGNAGEEDRISGGNQTTPFMYPWMVLLFYRKDGLHDTAEPGCGGTIINCRYILTAAHCIKPKLEYVRIGDHNLTTEKDCTRDCKKCYGHENIYIEKICKHPEFNKNGAGENDIALLRLTTEIDIHKDNTKPICLPLRGDINAPNGIITGWGTTENSSPSEVLLATQVSISDFEKCRSQYLNEYKFNLVDSQFCAGGKKSDTCTGDSGGPLQQFSLIDSNAVFVQYGITSLGQLDCGIEDIPAIYTRVHSYIGWILDTISE